MPTMLYAGYQFAEERTTKNSAKERDPKERDPGKIAPIKETPKKLLTLKQLYPLCFENLGYALSKKNYPCTYCNITILR